ncbi:hypothetical protein B0T21DRAFT_414550 [Apiosordaria backusii]|uniref:Uncharacterized protein n=1 Tax=Apiosordaria backusii TaxID=314023 RepID=A0AA40AST5_9PEZI|nr:hypothetical protein B0T21DRAFT_414550 [Apiosordaria backusii]
MMNLAAKALPLLLLLLPRLTLGTAVPRALSVAVAAQEVALPNIKTTLPTRTLNLSPGYGHVATYVDAATGHAFDFAAEGFTGEPSIVEFDSTGYTPRRTYTATTGALTPGNSTLQARDFCGGVARCYRAVASTATVGSIFVANAFTGTCTSLAAAARDYFRRDGYANLNAVLQGAVVGLAVNFVSVPIGNAWVNSLNKKAGGGSDSCAVNEREVLADDFGQALNFFCQTIALARKAETQSHFYQGDMNDDQNRLTGQYSAVKAYIAERVGEYVGICREMGVEWKKRDVNGVHVEEEW